MTITFSEDDLAAMAAAIKQHLSDCRTHPPMTYILNLGPWHVGPFPTHIAAQHWAEIHGVDDYQMIAMDDPAEAPGRIARIVRERRMDHPRRWRPPAGGIPQAMGGAAGRGQD